MAIQDQIREIREEIESGIGSYSTSKELYEFRKTFLDNKEGKISQIMKGMKDVPKEDRPAVGKIINEIKEWATSAFDAADKNHYTKELCVVNNRNQFEMAISIKTIKKVIALEVIL